MCGIFGFAKREGWQSDDQMRRIDDVITNLTWESVVRGQDSTGLAIVSKEEKLIYRTLQQSDELVCSNEWNGILEKVDRDTTVFMGHVRFATHGTITIQNAHPFTKGSVIGAHNGVIYNHKDIASKIGKNVQVDSEVIFGLLNKKDKYQDVFDLLEGDYALSWVNEDYQTINLMHEDGRPLHIAYWKKARCLFWASTADIMEEALKSAGLVIDVYSLPIDTVYEYDTSVFWKSLEPKETKVETNENWNKYSNIGYYHGGWSHGSNNYGSSAKRCKLCHATTYRADSICYQCADKPEKQLKMDNNGDWMARCTDCNMDVFYDDLAYDTQGGYICKTCGYNSGYIKSSTDRIVEEKMHSCDFCGDGVAVIDMRYTEGYGLCKYCYDAEYNRKNGDKTNLPAVLG